MSNRYFLEKLSARLNEESMAASFDRLLTASTKRGTFANSQDLRSYLTEGALLNVTAFGSQAFSIPAGEYMVWMTDSNNTMLVPTKSQHNEVLESRGAQYEIFTRDMLANPLGFAQTLDENYGMSPFSEAGEDDGEDEENDFVSNVDEESVDRTALLRAMQTKELTETELADRLGVHVSAVSRLLRKPQKGPGDPGGRNPSMKLAGRLCKELNIDPGIAFPDIFGKRK